MSILHACEDPRILARDSHILGTCTAYRRGTAVAVGWGDHCAGGRFGAAAAALFRTLTRHHGVTRTVALEGDEVTREAVLGVLAGAPHPADDVIVWLIALPYAAGCGLRTAAGTITAADLQAAEVAVARRVASAQGGHVGHHLLYLWDGGGVPPPAMLDVHRATNGTALEERARAAGESHVGTHCVMSAASPYLVEPQLKPIANSLAAMERDAALGPATPCPGTPPGRPFAFTEKLTDLLGAAATFAAGRGAMRGVTLWELYRAAVDALCDDAAAEGLPPPPADAGEPLGAHYGGCGHVLRLAKEPSGGLQRWLTGLTATRPRPDGAVPAAPSRPPTPPPPPPPTPPPDLSLISPEELEKRAKAAKMKMIADTIRKVRDECWNDRYGRRAPPFLPRSVPWPPSPPPSVPNCPATVCFAPPLRHRAAAVAAARLPASPPGLIDDGDGDSDQW